MKLPRYSSTALPRTVNISPQMAGQAAATRGQLVNQAAGEATSFLLKMREASDKSEARSETAKHKLKLAEFANDPRWEQDEIDGKPTEQVMLEEFGILEKKIEGMGANISTKGIRESVQTDAQSLVDDVRLKLEDAGNRIRIRRTKAKDASTIDDYQAAGDWRGVDSVINEGYSDGLYTMAERDGLLEMNAKRERIQPYFDSLSSNDERVLENKAIEALTDERLDPEERVQMWRTMSSAADAQIAKDMRDRSERWSQNSTAMWLDFDQMSPQEISQSDISPEMKNAAIRMKRSESGAGRTSDSAESVREVEALMLSMYLDTGVTQESVSSAIADQVMNSGLSLTTALEYQKQLKGIADDVNRGANFSDILRAGELEIGKGFDTNSIFDVFGENAGKVGVLQSEFRSAMMRAKMEQGASFNPRTWYSENIDGYREKANAINPMEITQSTILNKLTGLTGDELQYKKDELIIYIDKMEDVTPEERATLYASVTGFGR